MSTPLGGGHIIFAFSAVRFSAVQMLGLKEKYLSYLYQIGVWGFIGFISLHGIAFGEDSSMAN